MSLLLIIVIDLGVGGFDQDMEDDMEEEEDEDILRQQQEEEEAARIEQEEAAQIQQEEILRQQQEEQAAQIQGQQEHRVHVHFENEQQHHAASVTHFSSGQRFSPKASSNYEMSEKVRDSVLDSMVAKRKHARSELRRSNRVRAARDIFSQFVNQIAPSASEHQRERDVLDTLQGEFLSEIRYDFPPSEDQE
jgi:flagellum-specific peptidoglycan hydrolase FlgJ